MVTAVPVAFNTMLLNLAAALQAEMAILDEIDSGLDIDALRDVATAVNGLKKPERSVLMVTHYRVSEGRCTFSQRVAPAKFCQVEKAGFPGCN